MSSSPREEASATGVEDMLARPDINSQLREAHERGLASLKDDLLRFATVNETIESVVERGFKVNLTEKQDLDHAFEKLMAWPSTQEIYNRRVAFLDLENKHNEA